MMFKKFNVRRVGTWFAGKQNVHGGLQGRHICIPAGVCPAQGLWEIWPFSPVCRAGDFARRTDDFFKKFYYVRRGLRPQARFGLAPQRRFGAQPGRKARLLARRCATAEGGS